jgi:hypothetical protein
MRQMIRVVGDILELLSNKVDGLPVDDIASAYARRREEATQRLGGCAVALRKGDETQALRLAEADPQLMDFITQLMFPEEPQWLDYCKKKKLPVPQPLDQRTIQNLQELYKKGITTNSPFYRDCRAAVSSRDDEKALHIIRTIVRLNPSDANAKLELERLRKKKLLTKLEDLKALLVKSDKDAVINLMEEIDGLGTESALARHEVYHAGEAVRKAVLRSQVETEAWELLEAAEKHQAQNDWGAVSKNSTRIRDLEKRHALIFSQEQAKRVRSLEEYAMNQAADARKQDDFNKALASLTSFADKVKTRLAGALPLPLTEIKKLERTFADFWNRVEQFHRPVPQNELGRIQSVKAELVHRSALKLRSKRLTRLAGGAIIIFILLGVGWTWHVNSRAQDYVRQLKDLHSRKLAGTAAKLIGDISTSGIWGLESSPALKAKLQEVKKWSEDEHEHLRQAEQWLDDLESEVANNYSGLQPEVLHQKLMLTTEHVQQLAPDLSASGKNRLTELSGKISLHFQLLRKQMVDDVRKQLADLNRLVAALDFKSHSSKVAMELDSLEEGLRRIEKYQQTPVPDLRLPEDFQTEMKSLLAKTELFSTEIAGINSAKHDMVLAQNLKDYKSALGRYSRSRFAEVVSAVRMDTDFPTEDAFAAALMFRGDLTSWEVSQKQSAPGFAFHPENVTDNELKRILAIRDDPELYSPDSTKILMNSIRLNEIFDETGGHYKVSLIKLIDTIVRAQQGHPLVKAYLVGNFYILMRERRFEWGLHYCPELKDDMNDLDSILDFTLRSSDCTNPKLREKYSTKLQQFFNKVASRKPYYELAYSYRSIVSQIVLLKIRYAGHVDDLQAAHLIAKDTSSSSEIWGISEQEGIPIAINVTSGTINEENLRAVRKWSPLFLIPMELRQAVAKHRKK